MKKLIYTFFSYTKASSKLLYKTDLPGWNKLFLPRDNATKKLISLVPEYDLIIGIADHNKNATQNRFDPKYVNKWGRRTIIEGGPEFYISNISIVSPDIYTYSSVTNGPCNRSAYLIMHEITIKGLSSRFGFFHLMKSMNNDMLMQLAYQVN